MSNALVVSLQNIDKSFGRKQVLRDVSITVRKGEIFGFLGPNGSGKSTTIRVMLGVLYGNAGTITLFGEKDYTSPKVHARIGYLAGDMVLDDDLTGKQYLEFVAHQYGRDCDANIQKLASLLRADLQKKIGAYSRGNRQKIGLIAALMHEPELLILDEPTSGFDPLVQDQFIDLIRDFRQRGGTVFMSSHILSEVQQLCDTVAFIKDGSILTTQPIESLEVAASKKIRIVASKATTDAIAAKAKTIEGLTLHVAQQTTLNGTFTGDVTELVRFLSGFKLKDVVIAEPDLDELFLSYYEDSKPEVAS
jgi:ABC-2 type transport system ATP-binding protein